MTGTVRTFDDTRGFGFIVTADGKQFFTHRTGILVYGGERATLVVGETVKFDIQPSQRGPRAVDVRRCGIAA